MFRLRHLALAGALVASAAFLPATVASGHGRNPPLRGRSEFLPPPGATHPGATGRVDAEDREADDRHEAYSRASIALRGLDDFTIYTLWADDPGTADTGLVQFAAVATDGRGNARWFTDTRRGGTLPFGATLADLASQAAEVRDGTGATVLAGEFPILVAKLPPPPPLRGASDLSPPAGSPFPQADGRVRAERRDAFGNRDERSKLTIDVKHVAAFAIYTLWGDDPATSDAALVQFAAVTSNQRGDAQFRADTDKGAALPFGATLDDLEGLAVEVRDDDGDVVLAGIFPGLAPPGRRGPPALGESALAPPGGAPFPDAEGKVRSEVRPGDPSQPSSSKLKIELRGLAANAQYGLFGDDPATPDDTLTLFATLTTRLDGRARYEIDTRRGGTLPFGASLADLAGQAIEVRDAADAVVLAGDFPVPVTRPVRPRAENGKSALVPPQGGPLPAARGKCDVTFRPAFGTREESSRLRVEVRELASFAQYTLWADDPATPDPAHVQFATITSDQDGRARFQVETRRGQTLPFGATLHDLAGQELSVRDAADAEVLTGSFPALH